MPTSREFLGEHTPDPKLLLVYFLSSFAFGPLFFVLLIPRAIRYWTLRYTFTEEGISMRWGILFRRETVLTYARIQDIHLRSHLVERWLGLGRVLIQTASGSAHAEMTIEGILAFEPLRDFIYRRSRGASDTLPAVGARASVVPTQAGVAHRSDSGPSAFDGESAGELAAVLDEIAGEMRAIREQLQRRGTER